MKVGEVEVCLNLSHSPRFLKRWDGVNSGRDMACALVLTYHSLLKRGMGETQTGRPGWLTVAQKEASWALLRTTVKDFSTCISVALSPSKCLPDAESAWGSVWPVHRKGEILFSHWFKTNMSRSNISSPHMSVCLVTVFSLSSSISLCVILWVVFFFLKGVWSDISWVPSPTQLRHKERKRAWILGSQKVRV